MANHFICGKADSVLYNAHLNRKSVCKKNCLCMRSSKLDMLLPGSNILKVASLSTLFGENFENSAQAELNCESSFSVNLFCV